MTLNPVGLITAALAILSLSNALVPSRVQLTQFRRGVGLKNVAFAQQMTSLSTTKEVFLTNRFKELSYPELNECIVMLEKLNPTEDPALSPLLNGIWEVVTSGYLTPGMVGLQALRALPNSKYFSCEGPDITISNATPRVSVTTNIKIGNSKIPVTLETELEAESGVRMKESYVKGKLGSVELPLTTITTITRDVLITYLDKDLLIARNSLGAAELLRRKPYVAQSGTQHQVPQHGTDADGTGGPAV